MQLLQSRLEVSLGGIGVEIAPAAQQLAHDRRQMQLCRESGEGRGVYRGGHDPPSLRARARYGCGNDRKLPAGITNDKQHPSADKKNPQPSHASITAPDMI